MNRSKHGFKGRTRRQCFLLLSAACLLWATGCRAPIGADRVSTREAYAQVERNALSAGVPSSDSEWVIHRYGLGRLADEHPDEAVRQLQSHARRTADRNILYAMSELSFTAARRIEKDLRARDTRSARGAHLGASVYAYSFL